MTKRLMIILLLGFFALGIQAQKGEYAVRNFGANMQSWGQTSKLEYQKISKNYVMVQRVLEYVMKL